MSIELKYFFDPVPMSDWSVSHQLHQDTLVQHLTIYKEQDLFPMIKGADLALFSIAEFRGTGEAELTCSAYRKYLYQLFVGDWDIKMLDLGQVKLGNSLEDTYFALREIVLQLRVAGITPIIIGGSQDLDWAIYQAFEVKQTRMNYVSVDPRFDLGVSSDRGLWKNYLARIIESEPNYLLNYIHMGYQSYLCHADEVSLLEKLKFEAVRLGELKGQIHLTEPFIRNASVISIDMSCVKQADAPAVLDPSPNGFSAAEICAVGRYIGMSQHPEVIHISSWADTYDMRGQTAHLIGQLLWHIIEGYSYRQEDEPKAGDESYRKYIVTHEESQVIFHFYKSRRSGRWWVELPNFKEGTERIVIPCSYEEYLTTLNQEVPERWYTYYNRF